MGGCSARRVSRGLMRCEIGCRRSLEEKAARTIADRNASHWVMGRSIFIYGCRVPTPLRDCAMASNRFETKSMRCAPGSQVETKSMKRLLDKGNSLL